MKVIILDGGNKLIYRNKDNYMIKTSKGNFTDVNDVIKKVPSIIGSKNVKKCNMQDRINVVYQDALEVNLSGVAYDLIFIDAAKGQYTKFFEKYKYFLKPGGVIISDNLKFHGHVGNRENIANRNLKQLVGKIENYIDFLKENEEFETKFYDVGDGLSVSIRKNDI